MAIMPIGCHSMVCRSASSVEPYQNTSPTPRKAPPEIRRDKHFLSAYVKIGRRMASLANWVWPGAPRIWLPGKLVVGGELERRGWEGDSANVEHEV